MASKSLENKKDHDSWPQDLLLLLLLSLPAKSLLRFKSVSRPWRSLISSPDFVEQHLEEQQKKEYPQLIFASTGSKSDILLELVSIVDVKACGGRIMRKGFQRTPLDICHLPTDTYYMSNTCDGILCFYGNLNLFLYNPGTREFRILQIAESGFSFGTAVDCFGKMFPGSHLIGIGRDQVTKECKIMRLVMSKTESENFVHECQVLTLSSDHMSSWRDIKEGSYLFKPGQQPVYINGALHWLLDSRHVNHSEVIVSFDFHTEKFQVITHPSCFSDIANRYLLEHVGLVSLRSSLCLVEPELGLQLNVWIFNHGDGIWSKLFSIDWELLTYRHPLAFPIAALKDGSFFISHFGDNLQAYDPESKSFSEVLLKHGRKKVVSAAYSESLLSVFGESLVY